MTSSASIQKVSSKQSRYLAYAFDYDGTLATDGRVDASVAEALRELKRERRRLILVTGRRLEELLRVFQDVDLFDYIVCENGGVLYRPSTKSLRLLAEPAPRAFIEALRRKGISNLEIGRVIIATWHPNESRVLEAIQELGLDWQITFNKGAVMVLPAGVNKCTGLRAALEELGISVHNVLGVGDAENDHAFLSICGYAVAVANALPSVKSEVDLVTQGDHGQGIIELVHERGVNESMTSSESRRHNLVLGSDSNGMPIQCSATNSNILVVGPSRGGKTTVCRTLLKELSVREYQYVVVDPEGDYEQTPQTLTIGNRHYPPESDDILRALESPRENVCVNLLAVNLSDRPRFLARLWRSLQEFREERGVPHWVFIDEAHHVLHPYWEQTIAAVWDDGKGRCIVTCDPREISKIVLATIDIVIAVGENPGTTLSHFADALGIKPPRTALNNNGWGDAVVWFRREREEPQRLHINGSASKRRRHARKYALGDVGRERSFYFCGEHGLLNIRVQNLFLFLQVGEGVDDATWLYHLRRGDYSAWFESVINDSSLAQQVRAFEQDSQITATVSREMIRKIIEAKYTFPSGFLES